MPMSDRDRRILKYAGIGVGVLLVLFLGSKLLFGGGGGGGQPIPPGRRPTPTPTPTPTATKTPTPVAQFGGRDPFSTPPEFLVSGTSSSSGEPSSSSSSPGGSSSSPGGGGSSSGGPPPSQPGGGSSANLGGHTVVLLDAFSRNGVGHAQVEIDGVVYTVAVGERFGPGNRFELRSVSGNCGTFVFGDEQFSLCITPSK
jgi:hypothetical protein